VNENVAAGAAPDDAGDDVLSQDMLDSLIAQAEQDEAAPPPAPEPAPQEDTDLISQDMLDQLLSDAEREEEEAKAEAEAVAAAPDEAEAAEAEPEPEPEPGAADAASAKTGGMVPFVLKHGARLAASLAAALLTGVITYGLLASHPLRPAPGMAELTADDVM